MQLGTNSVDTPKENAQSAQIELQENDLVLAVSDGVVDNLWEHEVLKVVLDSLDEWDSSKKDDDMFSNRAPDGGGAIVYTARKLLQAAKDIAQDPFAESPYMEKAIEEGLTIEGGMLLSIPFTLFTPGHEQHLRVDLLLSNILGKMDDISVVIGRCMKRKK